MFIDFLITLWNGVLGFLSGLLPTADTSMEEIPAVITEGLTLLFFYVDPSPFAVLMTMLSGLLIGFVIYKVVNTIFNWISGLF